jgi:phosphohistidine swiveling domain-containing protein
MMTAEFVLRLADQLADLATVGGKGASLARLSSSGLPVPDGFHVTTLAYRAFVEVNDLQPKILAALDEVDASRPATLETASKSIRDIFERAAIPSEIASQIVEAYSALPGRDPAVAVRSSATAEDLPGASFAGQQDTYLNVSGASALLEAAKKCWSSLWTGRAIGYRLEREIDQVEVSLAVIVQLMVPAESAGIMFTANPVNGKRDELVISAAWGLGEAVVGGKVTPDNLIVEKASFRVISRETTSKEVMTIRANAGTQEQPVPQNLRRVAVLDDEAAAELAKLGTQIEELYQMPMDIEWAWADGKFSILQARPVTALPKATAPTDWILPNPKGRYMRNNIVELMADPLTPLFGSLGLSAINTSMGRLLSTFFGSSDLMPDEIIVSINGYAYYNGSWTPGQIGRILLSSIGIMKRMFTGAVERWVEVGRPRSIATVERWQAQSWRQYSSTEILDAVRQLSEAAIDAYGSLVSGVIPAAWISEGIFTFVYDKLIKRRDDPEAPTYLLGFDSAPIRAEKSLYDLAQWARSRPGLSDYLRDTPAAQIADQIENHQAPAGVEANDWNEWQIRFQTHLGRYGHMIYNLDFANPVPADDPTPQLETCKLFMSGHGINPHTRQQAAAERRERATQAIQNRLKGLRFRLFRRTLASAQRYAPLREDGLADVGLSYPLLRQMLCELGRRFVDGGLIETPGDIYWLKQGEVEQAATRLDRGEVLRDLSPAIPPRQAAWRAARRVTPPVSLPPLKFLGKDLEEFLPARGGVDADDKLKGVPASPGRVTAPARVVNAPEDFAQMKAGEVLVAAITTPAWTPLFARAAAVVTDVGGPLSHGSIVAREYGIPAVLGTGAATKRIHNGQVITVDGSAGIVTL